MNLLDWKHIICSQGKYHLLHLKNKRRENAVRRRKPFSSLVGLFYHYLLQFLLHFTCLCLSTFITILLWSMINIFFYIIQFTYSVQYHISSGFHQFISDCWLLTLNKSTLARVGLSFIRETTFSTLEN